MNEAIQPFLIAPGLSDALALLAPVGAIGVGLVFLQAGLTKLRYRMLVAGVVANYRLLPPVLIAPVAMVLPFAELGIGGAMIAGWRTAAVAGAALLLIFAAAMEINIRRGRGYIDCGCGRPQLRQPLNRLLVVRNIVLTLLLLPRLLSTPRAEVSSFALGAAGGVAIFVLFQLFNGLAALSTSPLAAGRR